MYRSKQRVRLCAAAGLVLFVAGAAAIDVLVTVAIKREATAAGGSVGRVTADPFSGRVVLNDVDIPVGAGHVRIGWIALSSGPALVTPALAAESVTLDDVVVETGLATYRMPKIEVRGSSVGHQQLADIFARTATDPLAPRLAALSAASVIIPELVVEQTAQGNQQTAIYRDIALDRIVDGRVASMTAAGGAITAAKGASGKIDGVFGPIAINDFDLVLMTRLYTDKAGPNEMERKLLYSDFSMEKIAFRSESGGAVAIGRIAGRGFKARPTAMPWLDAMRLLGESAALDKLPENERTRLAGALVDILDAFEIGRVELVDLTVDDPAKGAPGNGRVGRIAFTGGAMPEVKMEGMEVTTPDVTARIGLAAFSGFSFKPTLEALRESLTKPEDADVRRFIPELGTIRIGDVGIDVADEARGRIKMAVESFDINTGKPLNGIPTTVRTGLRHIVVTIPSNSEASGLKDLLDLGYTTLNLSFLADGMWNEAGNEFVVKELSAGGVDMGSVAIRGTLGNVTKDLFSVHPAVAQVALLGTTVKTAHLTLEDNGLIERALAHEAQKQGRPAAELRAELGMAAAIAIPAILGSSRSAKELANAIAKFVAKPDRLEISIRTKDPGGLGLADFAATGGEPAAILDRLEITATAE